MFNKHIYVCIYVLNEAEGPFYRIAERVLLCIMN